MTKLLDEILWPDTPFDVKDHLVLVTRAGSHSHGTYIPPSDPDAIDDVDIVAVAIPPQKYYVGLSKWENSNSIKEHWDVVVHEFRKFVSLLMKQNPNVLGMLWLEEEDYIYKNIVGHALLAKRNLFKHKDHAYNSFLGYATSQLRKMSGGAFKGYMGDKRKKLVERHGYDCKNAAHLVRLLHMGTEYLETGEMNVRRTWDRDMIMDIKQGKWKLDEVKNYAETWIDNYKAAYFDSPLPTEINRDEIEDFVINCLVSSFITK